jgi:hypothetical protein
MIELVICGYNIFCHANNFRHQFFRDKYPPDVAQLCQYFEDQKSELPDYCNWHDKPFTPKRRNEF